MNFSVAMCVYSGDNPVFFDHALNSIIKNTEKPNEIILVVDGPVSDKHEKIINKYKKILTVYRFKENQGHGNARRKSLELCNNELVAIMDADDICCPNRFEKQIDIFIKNPTVSIVGGQIEEFIGSIEYKVGKRIVPLNDKDIKTYIKKRCPMNLVTVMFNKEDVLSVGGFVDWYCEEDYYLWLRMYLANMVFVNVEEVLVCVRVGNEMYKRRGGWKYFKSELKLQNYMLRNKIIKTNRWILNVLQRFILQVLMPNSLRKFIFKKFARE